MKSFYFFTINMLLTLIAASPIPEAKNLQQQATLSKKDTHYKRATQPSRPSSNTKSNRRESRSFDFDPFNFGYYPLSEPLKAWNREDLFINSAPLTNLFAPKPLWNHITVKDEVLPYEVGRNGHITPDYTSGFDYPDPLLRTGLDAKLAVAYLYSKELFFSDIPHWRLMVKNQKDRIANGLGEHTLGSLRPSFPFYRHEN